MTAPEDSADALLDVWGRDRLDEHKRRVAVRRAWPELAQRLDDLLDTTTPEEGQR